MGGEGFEPPATWPPAKFFAIKIKFLRYHTKLDHPPFTKRASNLKDPTIKRVFCY